jgi:hypothetical protein
MNISMVEQQLSATQLGPFRFRPSDVESTQPHLDAFFRSSAWRDLGQQFRAIGQDDTGSLLCVWSSKVPSPVVYFGSEGETDAIPGDSQEDVALLRSEFAAWVAQARAECLRVAHARVADGTEPDPRNIVAVAIDSRANGDLLGALALAELYVEPLRPRLEQLYTLGSDWALQASKPQVALRLARVAFSTHKPGSYGDDHRLRPALIAALVAVGEHQEALLVADGLPDHDRARPNILRMCADAKQSLGLADDAVRDRIQADDGDTALAKRLAACLALAGPDERVAALESWLADLDEPAHPGAWVRITLAVVKELAANGSSTAALQRLALLTVPVGLEEQVERVRASLAVGDDPIEAARGALGLAQAEDDEEATSVAQARLGFALWTTKAPEAWGYLEEAAMALGTGELSTQVFAALDEMEAAGLAR